LRAQKGGVKKSSGGYLEYISKKPMKEKERKKDTKE